MKQIIFLFGLLVMLSSFVFADDYTTYIFQEGCASCNNNTDVPHDYLTNNCGGTINNDLFFAIGNNPLITRLHFNASLPYLNTSKYEIKNYLIDLTVYATDGIYATVQNMTTAWSEASSSCTIGQILNNSWYILNASTQILNLTPYAHGLNYGVYLAWNNTGTYAYGRTSRYATVGERPELTLTVRNLTAYSIPVISNMNCTSCGPNGDTVSPYSTSDTTPTFKFDTDVDANCRMADQNLNYTAMGDSRNETCSGQQSKIHICTLLVQDELGSTTDYVYIGCANSNEIGKQTSNASVGLEMGITGLSNTTSTALETGIQRSVIWPGATIYSNQQVYLRNLNNNQVLATVDKVAVYGSQRWILNVENMTTLGLFNITPVVYVFDAVNMSPTQIEDQVSLLINSTKR